MMTTRGKVLFEPEVVPEPELPTEAEVVSEPDVVSIAMFEVAFVGYDILMTFRCKGAQFVRIPAVARTQTANSSRCGRDGEGLCQGGGMCLRQGPVDGSIGSNPDRHYE
jgi:hypothetical protein